VDKSSRSRRRTAIGYLAMAGGVFGLVLAPIMVAIKYMTGWAIIPEPAWVPLARAALRGMLPTTTPPELWMIFGTGYTVALLLMVAGVVGLADQLKGHGSRLQSGGFWLLLAGLILVVPGDAIHTWTWHQNGLTTPTPGTNPVANTAYATQMMGMNLVMIGSMLMGIAALRRRSLAPWLAWAFVLIFPSAVLASVTLLPTTPSGALWLFSALMIVCGYSQAMGRDQRLSAA
jgi:hypothetical protein